MANRLEAVAVREYTDRDGNKKSAFTRIGTAFETKNGWAVSLDAYPVPTMGERGLETRFLLMTPKPREESSQASPRRDRDDPRTSYGDRASSLDEDAIPF